MDEAKANLAAVKLDVKVRVPKAFQTCCSRRMKSGFTSSMRTSRIGQFDAARVKYSVGNVPHQDVLKTRVALTGLAEHAQLCMRYSYAREDWNNPPSGSFILRFNHL